MIYYIFPILLYFIFLIRNINRKMANFFLVIIILLITIFGSLRYQIGNDWSNYEKLFRYSESDLEIGFRILTNIIKGINDSYQLFVFVIFNLAFFTKIWAFKKLSASLILSLMIYMGIWLMVFDINQIRQGLALGFIALAIYYCYTHSLTKYCLFVILAATMHYSALIFFPFYFLLNIRIKKSYLVLLVILALIFAASDVTEFIVTKVTSVMGLESRIVSRLYGYSINENYNANILLSFSTIHRFLIFAVTILFIDKIPADSRMRQIILMAAFLNIFIYLIFSQFEVLAVRVSSYYRFMECIFFSYLPFIFHRKLNQNIVAFILVIYVLLQIYIALAIPEAILLPYNNVLTGTL